MPTLSGFLYSIPRPEERLTALLNPAGAWVSVVGNIPSTRWERIVFHSPTYITGRQPTTAQASFDYVITLRQSPNGSLLMLSDSKKVVDIFTRKYCRRVIRPPLIPVSVKVGELVRRLVENPDIYVLTAAYVRLSAFGEALSKMSFFGEDLANASLFRSNLDLVNPFTCGLGKVNRPSEILKISNDGSVTTSFNRVTATEIIRALNYIFELGLINDGRSSDVYMPDDDFGSALG